MEHSPLNRARRATPRPPFARSGAQPRPCSAPGTPTGGPAARPPPRLAPGNLAAPTPTRPGARSEDPRPTRPGTPVLLALQIRCGRRAGTRRTGPKPTPVRASEARSAPAPAHRTRPDTRARPQKPVQSCRRSHRPRSSPAHPGAPGALATLSARALSKCATASSSARQRHPPHGSQRRATKRTGARPRQPPRPREQPVRPRASHATPGGQPRPPKANPRQHPEPRDKLRAPAHKAGDELRQTPPANKPRAPETRPPIPGPAPRPWGQDFCLTG